MAANLHILDANVNGIRARKTETEQYLTERKPHIVLFNETKLCGKPMPRFAGFKTAALRDRTNDKIHGGGVAILVSNIVAFSDISPDIDDIVAIEVSIGNSKYVIVSYYCPPDNRDLNSGLLVQYCNSSYCNISE